MKNDDVERPHSASVLAELQAFWFAFAISATVGLLALGLTGCALSHLELHAPRALPEHIGAIAVSSTFELSSPLQEELNLLVADRASSVSKPSEGQVGGRAAILFTILDRVRHRDLVGSGPDGRPMLFAYTTYEVRMLLIDDRGKEIGSAKLDVEEDSGVLAHDRGRERQLIVQGVQKSLSGLLPARADAFGPRIATR